MCNTPWNIFNFLLKKCRYKLRISWGKGKCFLNLMTANLRISRSQRKMFLFFIGPRSACGTETELSTDEYFCGGIPTYPLCSQLLRILHKCTPTKYYDIIIITRWVKEFKVSGLWTLTYMSAINSHKILFLRSPSNFIVMNGFWALMSSQYFEVTHRYRNPYLQGPSTVILEMDILEVCT